MWNRLSRMLAVLDTDLSRVSAVRRQYEHVDLLHRLPQVERLVVCQFVQVLHEPAYRGYRRGAQ